jgi:hypothetical protein
VSQTQITNKCLCVIDKIIFGNAPILLLHPFIRFANIIMAPKHVSSFARLFAVVQLLLIARHAPTISAFALIASSSPSPVKSLHRARSSSCHRLHRKSPTPLLASSPEDDNNKNAGVIDLTDDEDYDDVPLATVSRAPRPSSAVADGNVRAAAPFLSQGELSDDPNLLSPDFSDGKQSRVIIYIILTLVPILFLVPLMIGSRDLIPLDALPPVELTNN